MLTRNNGLLVVALFSIATLVGCGGGGGGGSSTPVADPIAQLAGVWDFTVAERSNSCDVVDPEPTAMELEIVQDGANLTITDLESGAVMEGTVAGNTVTIRMEEEFGEGPEALRFVLDGNLDASNADVLSGVVAVRASVAGEEFCAIESDWSGTRRNDVPPAPPAPVVADFSGVWDVSGVLTTACAGLSPDVMLQLEIAQNGADVEITETSFGPFGTGTVSGSVLTFTVDLTDPELPEFVMILTGTLEIAPDGQSFTGNLVIDTDAFGEICQDQYSLSGFRAEVAPQD